MYDRSYFISAVDMVLNADGMNAKRSEQRILMVSSYETKYEAIIEGGPIRIQRRVCCFF
jgi:hypothetical protein